nr:MAG TPA: tail fiber protein [Caudoviricetes sp.]
MPGKQVTELDTLPSFTDTSLLPVHNGAGLKKGTLTQLSNFLGTKFSNPNLLINPDFKINQRGKSTYSSTGAGATVDRWLGTNAKTVVNSDNTVTVSSLSGTGYFTQHEENISYGKHTYSIYVQAITGTVKAFYKSKNSKDIELGTLKQGLNTFTSVDDGFKSFFLNIAGGSSVTLKYVKVEQGTVATAFIAPNMAEEITKCKRYFQVLNVFEGFVGSVSYWHLYTKFYVGAMRTTSPTITANVSSATINLSGDNTDRKLQLGNSITPTMYLNELIITHKSATNFGYNAFTACIFRSAITYNVDAEIY